MTMIPSQLGSAFSKLKNIYLGFNSISHIPSASLTFVSPFLVMFHFNSNKIKKVAYSEVNRRLQRKSLFFDLTNRIIRVLLVSLIGNLTRLRFVNLSDNKLKLTETYRLRRGRL